MKNLQLKSHHHEVEEGWEERFHRDCRCLGLGLFGRTFILLNKQRSHFWTLKNEWRPQYNLFTLLGCKTYDAHIFKWAKPGLFSSFPFFSHEKCSTYLTINDKSIASVLGTQTCGGRMVGANESTDLWWHPYDVTYFAEQ